MATQVSRPARLASAIVVVMVLVVSSLAGCTPRPDGPAPVAEQFFAALAGGNTSSAAALADRPEEARAALNAAWAGLQADRLDAQITGSGFTEDTGSVDYRYTWHLPKNRTWTYDGRLSMIREEGRWEVRWTPAALHPRLGEHQTFALRADPPQRAAVNEVGGSDILKPGFLYHYELDAAKAGTELMSTARAVVDALRPFDDTFDAQRLAEQASSLTKPVDLITLKPDDNNRVFPAIGHLPGIVVVPQPELLPTDQGFAPDLVAQVKKAVVGQLDGEPGWRVVTVNQNGVDVGVLNEVPGTPAPSVSVTLDRSIQDAAQHAV
ncbi:MAG: penicillin-binding transpeptidase domain-containing protein, partial [Mycobacteriaceae bacterium]|nr:penicillin-binding transpeptidase domain-containing protein [Mycobacteriaceae bacterium]